MCGFFFPRNDPDVDLIAILKLTKHGGPDSTKTILSEILSVGLIGFL